MKNTTISVIIPVYNAEDYLEECLNSICKQTYKDFELLLIDDGSQDSSGTICDNFVADHSFAQVFHQKNSGSSASRNYGISQANGEYITFMDADDMIDDDYLELLLKSMKEYHADLVICSYDRFYNNDLDSCIHYKLSNYSVVILNSQRELAGVFVKPSTNLFGISVWGKLYHTNIIKDNALCFPEDISYEEDCCFNLQYYSHVNRTVFIKDTVYHYRQIENSLSKKIQPDTFQNLVHGFQKRKEFAATLQMDEEECKGMDIVFLITIMNNYKKIAMSEMSHSEKKKAYQSTLDYPEVKKIFKEANLSKNRFTRWLTKASKKENVFLITLLMDLWTFKANIREKRR